MNRKSLLGDPPQIRATNRDLGQLENVLAALPKTSRVFEFLRREVDRAMPVDEAEVDAPFIKLGSRVTFEDDSGKTYTCRVRRRDFNSDSRRQCALRYVGRSVDLIRDAGRPHQDSHRPENSTELLTRRRLEGCCQSPELALARRATSLNGRIRVDLSLEPSLTNQRVLLLPRGNWSACKAINRRWEKEPRIDTIERR
jgi:hypothetical protein